MLNCLQSSGGERSSAGRASVCGCNRQVLVRRKTNKLLLFVLFSLNPRKSIINMVYQNGIRDGTGFSIAAAFLGSLAYERITSDSNCMRNSVDQQKTQPKVEVEAVPEDERRPLQLAAVTPVPNKKPAGFIFESSSEVLIDYSAEMKVATRVDTAEILYVSGGHGNFNELPAADFTPTFGEQTLRLFV